jgi:hypothetical protein
VCGSAAVSSIAANQPGKPARWTAFVHIPGPLYRGPLDLAGPRRGGSLVLEAGGRLWLLSATGHIRRFARAYSTTIKLHATEPYIAQSPGGCFGNQTVYALQLLGRPRVLAITPHAVRRLTRIKAPGLLDGIAFDQTGDFGHRLLVMITNGQQTTVDAIGCHGTVTTITRTAPQVEGGIAVAPATFGPFAGDLIAPSEQQGKIYAITPQGNSLLVADAGLPTGQDIGVESEAFVPPGQQDALLASRPSRHGAVLRLKATALKTAGVHPGDLLVATEGKALTDAISCSATGCTVKYIANGPSKDHVEGHIAFAPAAQ